MLSRASRYLYLFDGQLDCRGRDTVDGDVGFADLEVALVGGEEEVVGHALVAGGFRDDQGERAVVGHAGIRQLGLRQDPVPERNRFVNLELVLSVRGHL